MNGGDWYDVFVPFVLLGLFVLALFGLYRTKWDLIKPPLLTINSDSEIITSEDNLIINGVTEGSVGKLKVNNIEVRPDSSGNFQANVQLSPGQNKIKVVAYNYELNKATKEIAVTKEAKTESVLGTNTEDIKLDDIPGTMAVTKMTESGPTENVAIIGVSLLITLFIINFDLKRSKRRHSLALQ